MLALTHQILTERMNEVVAKIQSNIKNKQVTKFGAMNASGKTAASLHYEIDEKEIRLYGAGHIFALEYGRRPTSGGGTGTSLRDRIRVWIDEKGINPTPGANGRTPSKDSLAFLIARKIHREGTELFKQGGNSGILSEVLTPEFEKGIAEALFYEFEMIVTNKLLNV